MSEEIVKSLGNCLRVSGRPSWAYLVAFLLVSACAQQPISQQPPTAELQPAVPQVLLASTLEEVRVRAKQVPIQLLRVSGDDVVCRKEVRVGSHMRRERCFSRRDLDEATRNAQEWLRTSGFQGSPSVAR